MLRLPIHVPNKFSHNDDNCYDHDDDDIRIPTEVLSAQNICPSK